jgi:hypothetical protein
MPTIGMGATLRAGAALVPCTIVRVSRSGYRIELQRDGIRRRGDRLLFVPDAKAEVEVATRRRDGAYKLQGSEVVVEVGQRQARS